MRFLRAALPLLLLGLMLGSPAVTQAQDVVITVAPPELVVYEQPPIPGLGYIWTPGYWAYGPDGYYWVPGTWVRPPAVGLLWTPGYWAFDNDVYVFHTGYWGPEVGYYGGVVYGYGYTGVGYGGGYWRRGSFFYNRTVNNFGSVRITNVYSKTVVVDRTTRVSFNGGPNGIRATPTQAQLAYAKRQHVKPTAAQMQQRQAASRDRGQLASVNRGKPQVAATPKSGAFKGRGVVPALSSNGNKPGTPATAIGSRPAGPKPGAPEAGEAVRRGQATGANRAGVSRPAATRPSNLATQSPVNTPRGSRAVRGPSRNVGPSSRAPGRANPQQPQVRQPPRQAQSARRPGPMMQPQMRRPAQMNRPAPRPQMNRPAPRPQMNRPPAQRPQMGRPAPQMRGGRPPGGGNTARAPGRGGGGRDERKPH